MTTWTSQRRVPEWLFSLVRPDATRDKTREATRDKTRSLSPFWRIAWTGTLLMKARDLRRNKKNNALKTLSNTVNSNCFYQ